MNVKPALVTNSSSKLAKQPLGSGFLVLVIFPCLKTCPTLTFDKSLVTHTTHENTHWADLGYTIIGTTLWGGQVGPS